MKIYTRTGDDGTTGLIGGRRLLKSELRIEAYGTLDELNATLGVAVAAPKDPRQQALSNRLEPVQNELFVLGSHLATPADSPYLSSLPPLPFAGIARMEAEIDDAEANLPPLKQFILPSGCELAARLHLARTICRRAERLTVHLAQSDSVEKDVITYLNRLSDWLFVQARLANHLIGVPDVPWAK